MTTPADDLETLSTEELRDRAFQLAERRRDIGFFWDLLRHVPASAGLAAEDASAGQITGGIAEAVQAVRELFGHDLGELELLFRARFLDYLRAG